MIISKAKFEKLVEDEVSKRLFEEDSKRWIKQRVEEVEKMCYRLSARLDKIEFGTNEEVPCNRREDI